MPTTKNLLLYAIALVVIAFVVSKIPSVTLELLSADHDHDDPIALGTNVWPGFEPFYLAQKTGLLAETDARLLEYSSSTQVMRSFANGTIDAAALTLDEVLTLSGAGVDAVVVLVLDFSNGGDAIVANPDNPTVASLSGKRIAAESTALGALMLSRALETNGLKLDDVDVVSAEIDEHEFLVEQASVDAVVTFSPVLDRLKARGMVEVFSSREIPGEIVDVLVVNPHLVEEHRQKLEGLVRSWFAALEYLDVEPQQSAELMGPRQGMTPAEVLQSLEQLSFPGLDQNREYLSGDAPRLADTASTLHRLMVDAGLRGGEIDGEALLSDTVVVALSGELER